MSKDLSQIQSYIRAIPDFPQKGVLFRDIFPLFKSPSAVQSLITHICDHVSALNKPIDVIVGLDARGFLFAPMVACQIGAAFVPVRKKGKLPGKTVSTSYVKEYGTDEFEMQIDAITAGQNVVIIDDVIATGGTAKGAGQLVKQFNASVLSFVFVIELLDLKGRELLEDPIYSIFKY
ncbi:adenine phosphoribosyltransferase [Paraphysoderma sedebokerense]|nr:adenine phosphoribosyltransferase [Paraphysoderma sedebokerense]